MTVPVQRGGCHCGAVRFEATGEIDRVVECNCSICSKKGYLHWYVAEDRFRLLQGADSLTTYGFNTGRAQHHFCAVCGVAPFYRPRSHPERVDVNLRCVDDLDLEALEVEPFDGRNWEASEAQLGDMGGPPDLRLEHLVDVPDALPKVASWHYAEWGHHGDRTPDSMAERLRGHLNRSAIPLTIVGFQDDRLVATAGLVEFDMDTRRDLTPWLADVFVDPELRDRRLGTEVVEYAVGRARELGVKTLHLFTPDRESFYARMGWSVRERVRYRDEDVVIMEIDLNEGP